MKKILIPLAVFSLWTGVSSTQAASTVDLSVTGVITPSACNPTLSNGGVYDLGKISARDLNTDQPTQLPAHNLQLTLTCEALTLVALKPSDNRAGSAYEGDKSVKFGLGLVNGNEKLGSMTLYLESIVADGATMYAIGSVGSSSTEWAPAAIMSPHFLTSFTLSRNVPDLVPTQIQQLTADVLIEPRIAPANTLTLNTEVPIDGSATLELNYL
ncbi:DUF1120 domain-containing protein [Pseudomonas trivialis]|uniref:DUF1120 domain-containing protein n=1 Tax=Pseudomonas trivialis TaxID=200450 RepID=A0A0H5APR5_9PSED|nr:DUF1120 domain-containing protein [Pseudomonas trivialis]AKS06227.1 hypothetical protein AA957_08945 [Pseudomonas trivialis]